MDAPASPSSWSGKQERRAVVPLAVLERARPSLRIRPGEERPSASASLERRPSITHEANCNYRQSHSLRPAVSGPSDRGQAPLRGAGWSGVIESSLLQVHPKPDVSGHGPRVLGRGAAFHQRTSRHSNACGVRLDRPKRNRSRRSVSFAPFRRRLRGLPAAGPQVVVVRGVLLRADRC